MVHTMEEKRLGRKRAMSIVRGQLEAYSFNEVVTAWQAVHDYGLHYLLEDWQKKVMQNLVFGQVVTGTPTVLPGLPSEYAPYGALERIEK
jgi:hypothetical protein